MIEEIKRWVSANIGDLYNDDGSSRRDIVTLYPHELYGVFDDLYTDLIQHELNRLNDVINEQRKIIDKLTSTNK